MGQAPALVRRDIWSIRGRICRRRLSSPHAFTWRWRKIGTLFAKVYRVAESELVLGD